MKITIDLNDATTKNEVLLKFGKTLELGGPNGNHPVSTDSTSGWGLNWSALEDSLRYLEDGGIWGTSKKYDFPLELEIINYESYKTLDAEGFETLQEILKDTVTNYSQEGKDLKVSYTNK